MKKSHKQLLITTLVVIIVVFILQRHNVNEFCRGFIDGFNKGIKEK